MSKTILTIVNLLRTASNKGEAKVNGRMNEGGGYVSHLQEKYRMKIEGDLVTLWHWGTKTLTINADTKEVLYYYGESNSDRDSMNTLTYEYDMGQPFAYRPVNGGFIYEGPMNIVLENALRKEGRL